MVLIFRHLALISLLWIFLGQANFVLCQNIDYENIIGKKYCQAEEWIFKNKYLTDSLLQKNIDPRFAFAIVFPEIIRFSFLSNCLETTALKTLYIQYGTEYANFSVGRFQMKPSFAEKLEHDYILIDSCDTNNYKLTGTDTLSWRRKRVYRLDSETGQLNYLIQFIEVMNKITENQVFETEEEKLKYYATAYNLGYWRSPSEIYEAMKKITFFTSVFFQDGDAIYSYSDISLYFYKKQN